MNDGSVMLNLSVWGDQQWRLLVDSGVGKWFCDKGLWCRRCFDAVIVELAKFHCEQ